MNDKNNKGVNVTAIIISIIISFTVIIVALIVVPKVVKIEYISEDIVMQSAKDGYVFRTREHKETKKATMPETSSTARETMPAQTTRPAETTARQETTPARQETTAQESRPMVEDTTPAYAQTTPAVAQTTTYRSPETTTADWFSGATKESTTTGRVNGVLYGDFGPIPDPVKARSMSYDYMLYYDIEDFMDTDTGNFKHLSADGYLEWSYIDTGVAAYIYENWPEIKETLKSLGSSKEVGSDCVTLTYRDDFFFRDGMEFIYNYSLEVVTVMDSFYIIGMPFRECKSVEDQNIYFILDYSYFSNRPAVGPTKWMGQLAKNGKQLYGYLAEGCYKVYDMSHDGRDFTLVLVGAHYE